MLHKDPNLTKRNRAVMFLLAGVAVLLYAVGFIRVKF